MNLNLSTAHLSEQVLNQHLMQWTAPIQRYCNFSFWLEADVVRVTPESPLFPRKRTSARQERFGLKKRTLNVCLTPNSVPKGKTRPVAYVVSDDFSVRHVLDPVGSAWLPGSPYSIAEVGSQTKGP